MEIKPCPFCGSEAKLSEFHSETSSSYQISCMGCGCIQIKYAYEKDKEKAIQAWNNRVE